MYLIGWATNGSWCYSSRIRLARRGQEITNLEGGYKSLEKEVEALKDRLNERDEVIAKLCGAADFLTNKRCRCNDDKVSPCS